MSDELTAVLDQYRALAAEYEAEPDDGLSNAEWSQLNEADELVRSATEAAARRRLKKRVPAAQAHLKDCTDALEILKAPARVVENSVAKVERDLAEARSRLAECGADHADDTDTESEIELDARLEIRWKRVALTDEVSALTARRDRVRAIAAPRLAERSAAEARRDAARSTLADLEKSLADPFSTETGRRTPEFERYVRYAGAWEEFPASPMSRRVLIGGLKFCGLYDGLVRDIVSKWLDGDVEVRKQSRILRDDAEVRVEQAPGGQIIAFGVGGRSRVSGETGRAPDSSPDMSQVTAATYASLATRA